MPFNLDNASRNTEDTLVKFFDETLAVTYNSGAKYQLFQHASKRYEQELARLQRKLQRGDLDVEVSDDATAEEKRRAADEAFDELMSKMLKARRDIADNICIVIEKWDLSAPPELNLDAIMDKMLEESKDEDGGLARLDELLKVLKAHHYEPTDSPPRTVKIKDKSKKIPVYGEGLIPIHGAWLAALPLPDEFIIEISKEITNDFSSGGSGTKNG